MLPRLGLLTVPLPVVVTVAGVPVGPPVVVTEVLEPAGDAGQAGSWPGASGRSVVLEVSGVMVTATLDATGRLHRMRRPEVGWEAMSAPETVTR